MSGTPAARGTSQYAARARSYGEPSRSAPVRHRPPARVVAPAPYAPEPIRSAGRTPTQRVQAAQAPRARQGTVSASRAAMYAFVTLAMVLLFIQISQLAQIAQNTKQISTLSSGIRTMKGETGNLTVRLGMQQNITRVREEAVYRLGMAQPEEGQIRVVTLNVPSIDTQTQTASNGQVSGD